MNPELDPRQIVHFLKHHASPLDEKTLASLARSRENALLKKLNPSPVRVFAGHVFKLPHLPHIEHQLLIVGLLAAALFIGADVWQNDEDQQNCDVDIAILTDELPLEVFVN